MKIISLECPCCKAQLQVNSELKQAACNYCGQMFQLEEEKDNRQMTFDNERDRLDAADAIAMETAEKIRSLIEPLEELERIKEKKEMLSASLAQQKEKLEKLNGSLVRKILWGSAAGIVGIGILLLIGGGVPAFFVTLLLGTGLVLLEFLWRKYRPVLLAGMVEKKEKTEAEIAIANEQIQTIRREHDLSYIPERYRTPEIMRFLCDALESKRVTTLQQAINLYEDELRHRQMYATGAAPYPTGAAADAAGTGCNLTGNGGEPERGCKKSDPRHRAFRRDRRSGRAWTVEVFQGLMKGWIDTNL